MKKRITITIDINLLNKIDKIIKTKQVSRSKFIEQIVENELEVK